MPTIMVGTATSAAYAASRLVTSLSLTCTSARFTWIAVVTVSREVSIDFSLRREEGADVVLTAGGGSEICVAGSAVSYAPSADCDEGALRSSAFLTLKASNGPLTGP